MMRIVRRHAKRVVALLLVVAVWWSARLPRISAPQRATLAEHYRFVSMPLPVVSGPQIRHVRPVHPSLRHINAWISSVGGSVALTDLDGDGLSNDVCYVDTRTDQVLVAPVPGTGQRYEPFALAADKSLYDRETMAPTGCLPGDFNEDGRTDVLIYFWGRPPLAWLRRETGSRAEPLSAAEYTACEIVPHRERWFTDAATRTDVDGDGHVDLIIGNYFPDGAHTLDTQAPGQEQMQHSMSRAFNGGHNHLLLWAGGHGGSQPAVEFHDQRRVWEELGTEVGTGWTLAVGAADLDGDQLPELYFGNDFGPDRLFHNRSTPGSARFALLHGRRTMTTPASKVLGHDSFKGMGVDFGDVNGDGMLDIYVSNIAAEYALEESHFLFVSAGQPSLMKQGVAPYQERSEALGVSRSGWGWESRLADFNNDGVLEAVQATGFARGTVNRWPELHEIAMGNDQLLSNPYCWHRFEPGDDLSGSDHNPFFARAEDGRFYDIAPELHLDQPQVSRGIATADVDGDGDLDFVVGNQWEDSRFYRNDSPRQSNQFLGMRLLVPLDSDPLPAPVIRKGLQTTSLAVRPAIGAAATVRCPGGQILAGQVDGGNGHSGARSPELHFGLGDVQSDDLLSVQLQWRDHAGQPQNCELSLVPGWYTIILAAPASGARQLANSRSVDRRP